MAVSNKTRTANVMPLLAYCVTKRHSRFFGVYSTKLFPFVTVTYLQIARFALLTTYFPIRRQWQFLQQTTRKQNPRELIKRILKRTLCRSLGTSEQPCNLRNRLFLQNIHGQ